MKLNILIRTSGRPQQFKRCINSVICQDQKNINILVSADDLQTEAYVKEVGITPLPVAKTHSATQTAPYNLYLNSLLKCVDDGWVMFLDDDDFLSHAKALISICNELKDENTLYIFRMMWPDGRVIPGDLNFNQNNIERCDIGMPNFVFHSKHIGKTWFQPMKTGDFMFIDKFKHHFDNMVFVDSITVHTGNCGAKGEPEKSGTKTVVVNCQPETEPLLRYTLRSVAEFIPDIRDVVIPGMNLTWTKNTLQEIPVNASDVISIDCGCILFHETAKRFYKTKSSSAANLLKEVHGKKGARFISCSGSIKLLKHLFPKPSSFEADTSSFSEMYNLYKETGDFETGVHIIKNFTKNRSLYKACLVKGDHPVMRKKLDISLKTIAKKWNV